MSRRKATRTAVDNHVVPDDQVLAILAGEGDVALSDDVPLSNLFVTIANQLGGPTDKFSDSTSDITEVVS